MSKSKKDIIKKQNEKWRIASQQIVDLRFKIEDILHMFDEEEKKSDRYRQLLESLHQQVHYVLNDGLHHDHIRVEIARILDTLQKESQKLSACKPKTKKSLKLFITQQRFKLQYVIIGVVGAVLLKLIETVPSILQFLFHYKGGE